MKEWENKRRFCSRKCADIYYKDSREERFRRYQFKKGHVPWNIGDTPRLRQEKNPNWRGDDAGYSAIHKWLGTYGKKSGVCSKCGRVGKTHWANISGEYRRDINDFMELCPKCHVHFDRYS